MASHMTPEGDLPIERSTIIRLTLLQAAIFLAVALVYALVADVEALGITGTDWCASIAWGFTLFLAAAPFLYLPRHFGIRNQLEETLATRLKIRDILFLNLLVSSSEELFFRGVLLRLFGVVPQALVFGAMHYIGYASFLEVAYALSTGLLLGYLYRYHLPNIFFPITYHFLANAFSLLLTRTSKAKAGRKGFETKARTPGRQQ